MLKTILFQLHWLLGISAGLVLSIMGITGALYAFEAEITQLINPQRIEVSAAGMLPPGEMVKRVEAATGNTVTGLRITTAHNQAAMAFLAPAAGERRGARRYFDPYTGQLLDAPAGQAFFRFVLQLHRWLAIDSVGKHITGASTLALIFFCLSGLYLRWPRQALNWRKWLALDWAKKGRALHWDLHAVAGTWALVFYLCMGLTGLWWSYGWYRQGLTALLSDAPAAQPRPAAPRERPSGAPPAPIGIDFDTAWQAVSQAAGELPVTWSISAPRAPGQPLSASYVPRDAAHPRASNQLRLDPDSGRLLQHDRYADKRLNAKILSSIYALHSGEFFGLTGRILMAVASAALPVFFITGLLLYFDRRRKKRAARIARNALGTSSGQDGWLIGFASQSGFAEQLAWQTAGQLQAANVPVQVHSLAQLEPQHLHNADKALFVISTFGEGDAPDSARGFERKWLNRPGELDAPALAHLNYALLALGDRQYQHYCGFAQRVHDWLARQGAKLLFPTVDVDGSDTGALERWQQQVSEVTGAAATGIEPRSWESWILQQRRLLNPGSHGGPTFLVTLIPPAQRDWEAGDIIEIQPPPPTQRGAVSLTGARPAPGPREYSIASLPDSGTLELIVRQERHPGGLGLCSGWLTESAGEGRPISARLRRNSGFHLPGDERPLILIGNGTGLAGLRALLKARIAGGHHRNWLLFGERHRAHDFYCQDELEAALKCGDLQRLDVAFSRDQAEKIYVQHLLRNHAETLRAWIQDGAFLYVCGSLQGMAAGVDTALRDILGASQVEQLLEQGRYRRDVY